MKKTIGTLEIRYTHENYWQCTVNCGSSCSYIEILNFSWIN